MNGMVREINEEGPVFVVRDELQGCSCEPITQVAAIGGKVGVLGKAECFWEHNGVEPLASRRHRSGASSAEVPHAEETGGVAACPKCFSQRQAIRSEFGPAFGGEQVVPR